MLWNVRASGKKGATARCFEIDQEKDAILLIIGIAYGVGHLSFLSWICQWNGSSAGLPCISFASDILFTLRSTEHMHERLVTSKVSCIRRKRVQIKDWQDINKSMVIFVSKGEKRYDKLFNVKYLPLFHHFKAIYQFPKHVFFGVKIVAKTALRHTKHAKIVRSVS